MINEKLTKADIEKIQKEIDERKTVLRPKILEDVKQARAQGDLSENFEYYAARKANRENNSRIEYLEKMIKNAEIIEIDDNGGVSLNSKVKVEFVGDNDTDEYTIVTSIRADSQKKRISIESPIGKALLGKKVGEVARVTLENGSGYDLKILEIGKDDQDFDLKTF